MNPLTGVARLTALALLAAVTSCGGIDAPRPRATASPFVVSTPRPMLASTSVAASTGDIVWIAIPAGTMPGADRVTIQVARTGETVTATAVDGGLDPVPLSATLGDQLRLTVTETGSSDVASYTTVVSRSKGPVVIRTSPPPAKRDVPLNTVIVIVFSEPVAGASLTPDVVRLTSGGATVAGRLGFSDSTHLTAFFQPDAPLTPATDYTLTITQGIRNADGQVLSEPVTVQFTTTAALSPTSNALEEFHVNGTVTDEVNTPLSGAWVAFRTPNLPGFRYSQLDTGSDGGGKFSLDLRALLGMVGAPPMALAPIAFAWAAKDGYVTDYRYVMSNETSNLHFTLYKQKWIVPGDSVLLTVTPNDAVCDNNTQDMHPWPVEWRCRTVYISPSAVEGTLHLSIQPCQSTCLGLYAEPMDASANGARLDADSTYSTRYGYWTFMSLYPTTGTLNATMLKGFPMFVQVEVPWPIAQAETVWLHTSFTPAP